MSDILPVSLVAHTVFCPRRALASRNHPVNGNNGLSGRSAAASRMILARQAALTSRRGSASGLVRPLLWCVLRPFVSEALSLRRHRDHRDDLLHRPRPFVSEGPLIEARWSRAAPASRRTTGPSFRRAPSLRPGHLGWEDQHQRSGPSSEGPFVEARHTTTRTRSS